MASCKGPILYGGPQLSQQNQKPHGKNKIPHGKTKNHTAITKYLTAKPNTSQQKQKSFGGSCLLWVMSTEISVDIAVDIAVDSRSIVGR